MEEKVFAPREVVFREGEIGTSFFQILSGTAGVYVNYGTAEEQKLTEMKPGQYFGEMAVIDAWPRSSTIVAEDELRVLEIPESGLNEYFTAQPDKILAIMKQLSGRIRSLTEEYEEVTAFLKEKEESNAPRSSGFLAKLKKYVQMNALAKKNAALYTAETEIRLREFGRASDSPLPVEAFSKGKIIVRQGEEGEYMFAVHGGAVGIYSNYGTTLEKKLTTLYANSFFGEMGMLDHEIRSATAVADEDDTILEIIRAEDLEKLFKTNPIEVDMILCHLSNRLRRLTKDYIAACEAAAAD